MIASVSVLEVLLRGPVTTLENSVLSDGSGPLLAFFEGEFFEGGEP